eukprot:TRINITY_DN56969_c0_g1_i1.p1 TRINITY_DN56969_c0_g1~~TRINITY_DN56969_c0_g1_i1.p1  ORF type:complete len:590 (+),score=58.83 TRINITY_DN56969_c0_g1_i1:73-1770(+)
MNIPLDPTMRENQHMVAQHQREANRPSKGSGKSGRTTRSDKGEKMANRSGGYGKGSGTFGVLAPDLQDMVTQRLDVPVSYWGKIIGKGGETLKGLQEEFAVSIRVPRPDSSAGAQVTVRGAKASCEACAERIRELIVEGSRASRAIGKSKQKATPKRPFPCQCSLCKAEINGIGAAFAHLGSKGHLAAVKTRMQDEDVPIKLEHAISVAEWLEAPRVRDIHADLGFLVDELIKAAPSIEAAAPRFDGVEEMAMQITPEFEWLIVEQEFLCSWDQELPKGAPSLAFTKAPLWEEMLARVTVDDAPPMIRLPKLPSPLPHIRGGHKAGKKCWPTDPTSRLGLAVIAKNGRSFEEFDMIAGTSLMYALSGDAKYTRELFYLQRQENTVFCLHIPNQKSWDVNSLGHAVEVLLCGLRANRKFYASHSLRVGERRVLITSEVDARDAKGNLTELKSSKKGTAAMLSGRTMLQLAVNGASNLLCCHVDADESQLLKVEWKLAAEVIESQRRSFTYQGQRIRLLLDRILNDEVLKASPPEVVCKLSFNEGKAPVIELASSGVDVLPSGFPRS